MSEVSLRPMRPEAFASFAAMANEGYAQDHVRAGTWSAGEALAKATAQFEQLLPRGLDTPDHFVYEVHDAAGGIVGTVWFAVVGSAEARAGYVFNLHIVAAHRRRGHGRAALLALETIAAEKNLPAIRLAVFGHNPGAEALYRALGYRTAATTLRKMLAP